MFIPKYNNLLILISQKQIFFLIFVIIMDVLVFFGGNYSA